MITWRDDDRASGGSVLAMRVQLTTHSDNHEETAMEQGALATGFFLIALDETTGRAALHPELLACGLVGAQLADLVVAGTLTVTDDDRVQTTSTGVASDPADEAAALVLDSVAHEPRGHPVRAWIDALGGPLTEIVQNGLVQRGVLAVEWRRGLLGRRHSRLRVTDAPAARAPGTELGSMVRHPATFSLPGACTLVLLTALGVEQVLEPEIDRATAREVAGQAAAHLPAPLARLREGLTATATAVGVAVRR